MGRNGTTGRRGENYEAWLSRTGKRGSLMLMIIFFALPAWLYNVLPGNPDFLQQRAAFRDQMESSLALTLYAICMDRGVDG